MLSFLNRVNSITRLAARSLYSISAAQEIVQRLLSSAAMSSAATLFEIFFRCSTFQLFSFSFPRAFFHDSLHHPSALKPPFSFYRRAVFSLRATWMRSLGSHMTSFRNFDTERTESDGDVPSVQVHRPLGARVGTELAVSAANPRSSPVVITARIRNRVGVVVVMVVSLDSIRDFTNE